MCAINATCLHRQLKICNANQLRNVEVKVVTMALIPASAWSNGGNQNQKVHAANGSVIFKFCTFPKVRARSRMAFFFVRARN